MKNLISGLVATAVAVGALGLGAMAAAPKAPAAKHTKMDKATVTLKCPSCHMQMPTQKSAMYPVPVKAKGKTFYCCNQCASGKAAMKAMHMKKPAKKA